ncbi:hypothetical protein [Amycolatopsis aidingensis]|uniref:hypothetical protein n=1 Tax=Amycolatopsis aidingensis TaxID=2842453 RepID=UPI001C0AEF7F|nr:hypothetical protein [Amycolatopsis aidingensis]
MTRYAVFTSSCCGARTWVDVALLVYHWLVPERPLVMRCGRRYDHRKLPGRVGCDWPGTITIVPDDDGTTRSHHLDRVTLSTPCSGGRGTGRRPT